MTISVSPCAGDVLAVPCGFYDHLVVYVGDGIVISCSGRAGCVVAEPLATFAGGSRVRIVGYPGRLPRQVVAARAWAEVGKPYSLFSNNCEHFVARVHGLSPRSPQLRFWGTVAAAALLLARRA
jgi:hypothetical protein